MKGIKRPGRLLFPLLFAFFGLVGGDGFRVIAGEAPNEMVYAWPDRLESMEFIISAEQNNRAAIVPRKIGMVFISDFAKDLIDCSNDEFRCLRWGPEVLAISKAPLRSGQRYVMGGVEFRVEKCVGEARYMSSDACEVVLISGVCRNMHIEEGICDPVRVVPKGVSAGPDFVIYFLYHHRYGVTALGQYGLAAKGPDSINALSWKRKWERAGQYMLIGDRGLLRD